jgi:multidrug efflux pump subunit AcrB
MPLGLTIIGGLTFAQLLTIYVTPVIHLLFEKLNAKFSHRVET